jgi:hypothetical protein
MRRLECSRVRRIDLLARPPAAVVAADGWAALVVDPVEQLRGLADLRRRGLLSGDEYEQQRAKVLER